MSENKKSKPTLPREPGIYPGIPNSDYHADQDSLSSSGAKTLAKPGGAARFHYEQTHPKADSEALLFGTAAHAFILEGVKPAVFKGGKTLTSKKALDFITKERDEREDPDLPVVTEEGWETLQGMAEAVHENPLARRLLTAPGKAEQSVYWQHPSGATLRCRPDWLPEEEDETLGFLPIVDLKTTRDATPAGFRHSCFQLGYHQSAAWYAAGLAAINVSANARMVFIAVEKTPPYLVGVYTPSNEALEVGHALNEIGIDKWVRARIFNDWEALDGGLQTLAIKPYEIPENVLEEI